MNKDDQFKYAYGINEPCGDILPMNIDSGCSTIKGYEQNTNALNGRIQGVIQKAHAILQSYSYSIQSEDFEKMDFPVMSAEENYPAHMALKASMFAHQVSRFIVNNDSVTASICMANAIDHLHAAQTYWVNENSRIGRKSRVGGSKGGKGKTQRERFPKKNYQRILKELIEKKPARRNKNKSEIAPLIRKQAIQELVTNGADQQEAESLVHLIKTIKDNIKLK